MDHRFSPLLTQRQIDPRHQATVMALPGLASFPYTEWLIATALLMLLIG